MNKMTASAKAIMHENRILRSQSKRRCNQCKAIKALADFYYNDVRDQYASKCKKCAVVNSSIKAKVNRESINARHRSRPPEIKKLIRQQLAKWKKRTGRVNVTILVMRPQKESLKLAAKEAGMTLSAFVLDRCLARSQL